MKIKVTTEKPRQIVDITDEVNRLLRRRKIEKGWCYLFAKHTTVALTVADLDPGGTEQDFLDAFEKLVPKVNWRHPHDPSHMPDHVLAALIGPSLILPVNSGKLELGTWQRAVLVELNGPRRRELVIDFIQTSK